MCARPSTVCDLREVSLPESLRLNRSRVAHPSFGSWQLPQDVLPEADNRGSQNSRRPSLTSAGLSTARAAGRLYSAFRAASSRAEMPSTCAAAGDAHANRQAEAAKTAAAVPPRCVILLPSSDGGRIAPGHAAHMRHVGQPESPPVPRRARPCRSHRRVRKEGRRSAQRSA